MHNLNMKLLSIAILIFITTISYADGDPEIIGRWVMEDTARHVSIVLEFSFDRYISITHLGETTATEEGTYSVDNGLISFLADGATAPDVARYRVEDSLRLILSVSQGEIVFNRAENIH